MPADKPNVLFIMEDQLLAPQFLPCYGHGVVEAPTLERRAQGVSWDYARTPDTASQYARNAVPIYQLEKRA